MTNPLSNRFEMRASAEWLKRVDDWRRQQQDLPTRAEAIRRLVDLSLYHDGLFPAGERPVGVRPPERA